jgi:mono/diheme cytochrome c family protein
MRRWGLVGLLVGGIMSVGLLAGRTSLLAQSMHVAQARARVPPFDLKDRAVIETGARLFSQNCTGYCHGKEGRRARAPQLRGRQFAPDYLFTIISNGSPPMGALPMPAFKSRMSEKKIWKLVAYILSLAEAKGD